MSCTLSPNNIETIASIQNHLLESESNLSSLPRQEVNSEQNNVVNSVSNSTDVHISNTNNHIYNAPVVINNIYQQYDNIEQLPPQESNVQDDSFSKTFLSLFRSRVQQLSSTKYYIVISAVILLILIVGLIIWLFDSRSLHHSDNLFNNTSERNDFRIVSRKEWDAKQPKKLPEILPNLPPKLVIIHHTLTTLCYFLEQCINTVKLIQNDHMNSHDWNDIGYNFLVGGDGLVYEGRGWNIAGSHTLGYNYWSIGIGLIGSFSKEEPTKVQLDATQQLIKYGVKNGFISNDYELLGYRQCRNSENPGDALYKIIMTWDHWSSLCPFKTS